MWTGTSEASMVVCFCDISITHEKENLQFNSDLVLSSSAMKVENKTCWGLELGM